MSDGAPDLSGVPRLGILRTDAVAEELRAQHGDYPAMFRALLLGAGGGLGAASALAFRDFDVRRGEYPERVEACDAYLITGSRHSVTDEASWIRELEAFVRELHGRRHKLVGVCFGHQVVATALAGPDAAGEAGWSLGAQGARVRTRAPWMTPFQDRFTLFSSHRDQVRRLPEGAEWLLEGPGCAYAGFALGDHVLTFQGHPEFTAGYMRGILEARREQIDEGVWRRAMDSLVAPTHQALVGAWIRAFLGWREPAR